MPASIRPIIAVPEGLSVAKLISVFQEKHTKIAVVVDEFGGTAGIVTMSDIMDEIVGESDDEYRHDFEEEVKVLKEGVYRIEGGAKTYLLELDRELVDDMWKRAPRKVQRQER